MPRRKAQAAQRPYLKSFYARWPMKNVRLSSWIDVPLRFESLKLACTTYILYFIVLYILYVCVLSKQLSKNFRWMCVCRFQLIDVNTDTSIWSFLSFLLFHFSLFLFLSFFFFYLSPTEETPLSQRLVKKIPKMFGSRDPLTAPLMTFFGIRNGSGGITEAKRLSVDWSRRENRGQRDGNCKRSL